MKREERIETLIQLGLTYNQARAYLTLLKTGPATAKEISENSKIARPDIYRIIPTLQNKGIIEKVIKKPASFQAVPMDYVLPTMLKNKTLEQNKLKRKTQQLLNDFKSNHATNAQQANAEFLTVHGKEAIIQRLKERILKTQSSINVITTQKRFSAAILEFKKRYQEVLKNGIKIRIATNQHLPNKNALEILKELEKNKNFELKYLDDNPTAIVTIFDSKEACVTLSIDAQLNGASAIWSNNPCFVAITQAYFDSQWNKTSSTLYQHLK